MFYEGMDNPAVYDSPGPESERDRMERHYIREVLPMTEREMHKIKRMMERREKPEESLLEAARWRNYSAARAGKLYPLSCEISNLVSRIDGTFTEILGIYRASKPLQ